MYERIANKRRQLKNLEAQNIKTTMVFLLDMDDSFLDKNDISNRSDCCE